MTPHPFIAAADPLDHVLPHHLFNLGPFNVTNQMMMAVVAAVLMLLIFPALFRQASPTPPAGAKNFFESILEFLRVEVFRPALREHTDRFVPFLWTLFFFILFCNLLGQIPFGETITAATGKQSHLSGTATGTLTTTAALAICAFLFIHLSGIWQVARSLMNGTYGHHGHHEEHAADGASHDTAHDGHAHGDHGHGVNLVAALILAVPLYFWNFAPHPFKPGPGQSAIMWVPDIMVWALLLGLDLIGAAIKPFALMIRLFANMIAGHIVLAALILLIPVTAGLAMQIGIGAPVTVLSLLIRLLELFVAFLQAYIFTFLTTLFIASAVAPEH
jgi:F-type H+-transporting ATPase subunit a